MVRIPPALPLLPDRSDYFVLREPYGSIFEGLTDGLEHLAGFLFLRAISVVLAPYVPARNSNTAVAVENVRSVRFTTSTLGRYLFVAVGYSAVNADGYIQVETRAAHATIPGSGAVRDPGCKFMRRNGDLPNPVQDRLWDSLGLKWQHTGMRPPPSVVAADPVSVRPRMLHVNPDTDTDVVFTWNDVKLNSIHICEMYRPNV